MSLNGLFMDGSVSGVHYETGSFCSELDDTGKFKYNEGDCITFSIGGIVLGSCMAKEGISTVDLVPEACGSRRNVTNPVVANMARLLLSIGKISMNEDIILSKYRYTFNFCMEPDQFADSEAVKSCMEEMKKELISIEKTHNILRRCSKGIIKETDVKIPTKQGHYVLADIYHPVKEGKYPVIISMGAFGKSFLNGSALNEEEQQIFEEAEDKFYDMPGDPETWKFLQGVFNRRFGSSKGINPQIPNLSDEPAENTSAPAFTGPVSSVFEQVQADDWVPYGYIVMNVEEYGTGKNKGEFKQFGVGNAKDYCDVIEWAADQEWSTGKVGLFGASYYAMTQYTAAQRHPKGLTAMIPIMGDYDSYRNYVYSGGGLLNIADNGDLNIYPQERTFMSDAMANPFWTKEHYGAEAEFMSSVDITKIDYPIWPVVEPDASLHGMGSSEAYITCSSKDKKMMFINGAGIHFWMYDEEYMNRFRDFFDYWLKGEKNGIMDEPSADIQIRTGNGAFYWRHEANWPVPNTEYRKYYIDMSGDGLSSAEPFMSGEISYDADVKRKRSGRNEAVSFVSEPFKEDTEIAGYIKAGLYVSSTTSDMEIHMNVRVLDENGKEVNYTAFSSLERTLPLGFGSMKASHRMLDDKASRIDHPVYKHTKESIQMLTPGEIVYCEVGSYPTSGLIRKGWRLVLDISPVSNRWIDYKEASYRTGSRNTIYFGGNTLSYVQLPVLPNKYSQGKVC